MFGMMTPSEKVAVLRQYEVEHIKDIEDAANRGTEILMREIYTPKQERIRKFAQTLAERIDLKDPMLGITDKRQISGYIRRKYIELGVPDTIANQINKELPEEYKRKYNEAEIIDANGLISQTTNSDFEVKKLDNLRLQQEDEKLADEEKELKAKLARVRDVQALVHEEASERRLSLPSMKSAVISTPKPTPQDSEFSDALIEISNLFSDIAKKVIEFPPSEEDARRFAQSAQVYIQILQPLTDLKNTKDARGWLETIKTFEEYGKHAAAVKNAIQTPSGVNRPLTREQVGDKALEVIEGAIAMYNTDPLLVALAEHHRKYKEPRIAERKVNLHDTLSERA